LLITGRSPLRCRCLIESGLASLQDLCHCTATAQALDPASVVSPLSLRSRRRGASTRAGALLPCIGALASGWRR